MKENGAHAVSQRRWNWKRTLLCVVSVVLVLGLGVYGFYRSKLGLLDYNDGTVSSEGTIDDADSNVVADNEAMEQALENVEEADAILAQGEIFGDSNVFNVLLIGTDERSSSFSDNARGDACMLISLNKKTMQVTLASFERGMGVPVLAGQYEGQYDWLTHTFRYGGADLMMREIRECFKVDVNYYIRVNFNTFAQIIDALGGVDIELTEREAQGLNGEVYTNARTQAKVYPGWNHLSGYDALQYSRLRFIDNDWKRIARQRNVMETVIEQSKGLSLLELNALLDTVLPLVQTNLTERQITALLPLSVRAAEIQVQQLTVPASGTYGSMTGMGNRRMFAVDFAKNAEILQQALYGE